MCMVDLLQGNIAFSDTGDIISVRTKIDRFISEFDAACHNNLTNFYDVM